MTVEAYLRSLVIGLDLPDEVLERCARSPIEVGLKPLDLQEDIDAVYKEDEPEDGGEGGGGDELPDTPEEGGEEGDGNDAENETETQSEGEPESGDADEGDDSDDGDEPFDKVTDFQMRLDYASSNIYYAVLGVFSGGGYSEQVGDVKVTRSSYVITMADRERFKRLGDMLRRKWGWDVEDEEGSGIMDVSFLRSVI